MTVRAAVSLGLSALLWATAGFATEAHAQSAGTGQDRLPTVAGLLAIEATSSPQAPGFLISVDGHPLTQLTARRYAYFTDTADSGRPATRVLIEFFPLSGKRLPTLTLVDLRGHTPLILPVSEQLAPSDVIWEKDALLLKAGAHWYKFTGNRLQQQRAWKFVFH